MDPVHQMSETSSTESISNGFQHEEEMLTFQSRTIGEELLASLSALRKNQKFCDVTFVVEDHEVVAHRAVLAAQSATMFDILAKEDEFNQLLTMIKLKDMTFKGFMYLVDYMYTGRLTVPSTDVCEVYATARQLRLRVPARACADFLCSSMNPGNCLAVRKVAEDEQFQSNVNVYIQENLEVVMQSKSFFSLPHLQLEVVGTDEALLNSVSENNLLQLAVDWVKRNTNEGRTTMDRLTEKVNVLCLGAGNILQDCIDVDDTTVNEDLVIQDYKKLTRKQTGSETLSSGEVTPATPSTKEHIPFHKFSLKSEHRQGPREWTIISSLKLKDKSYVSLLLLDGHMVRMSLHFRAPQNSPDNSGSEGGQDSPIHSKTNSIERLTSIVPLGTLSIPRCAFGIRAVQGKIIACGGYDRGEIMKSAEMYDPDTNTWKRLPDMNQPRCRFTAAHLSGKIYAIGGSDGHNELSSVECFDPNTQKWSPLASLSQARASPGVAVLKGKIYCVGGSFGQKSLRKCEVYDPETDTWSPTASLKTGRFQACVRAFKNRLYAAGGTDGWNVFSAVEVFNPDSKTWGEGPPLNVARRGAGIEAFNGKLYIVGGSDGTQSLKTTESFDPAEQLWNFNPALSIPRANVGAAVLDNKLFAVGGYSGKKFLDSMEYYDVEQQEWCSFDPFARSRSHSMSSGSDSDVQNDMNAR